ncbi:hypothetical protein [Streptomyces sp. 147326]|uniref:hypothetical protein n=1 Tax=Streptomyces sp. 147326 TaxID=3074379 RepID=UPI003857E1D3
MGFARSSVRKGTLEGIVLAREYLERFWGTWSFLAERLERLREGASNHVRCRTRCRLFEQAAANGTPIREIVGEDPVEFAEAFVQNCSEGGYVPCPCAEAADRRHRARRGSRGRRAELSASGAPIGLSAARPTTGPGPPPLGRLFRFLPGRHDPKDTA